MAIPDLNYFSKDNDMVQDYKARGAVNLRIMKSLFNRSLNLSLYGNDLLRTMNRSWTMYGDKASVSRDFYGMVREIGLSVSYNFHPTRNRYKGTGAGNKEKTRF